MKTNQPKIKTVNVSKYQKLSLASIADKRRVLKSSVKPGNILLIGLWDVALLEILKIDFPQSRIVGLDRDPKYVSAATKEFPKTEFLLRNLLNWPDFNQYEGQFDTVVLGSTLHSIYATDGPAKARQAIELAANLLKTDGRLIIRDGLKPGIGKIIFTLKNKEIKNKLINFIQDYKGQRDPWTKKPIPIKVYNEKGIAIEDIPKYFKDSKTLSLQSENFYEFLIKYIYFGSPTWEHEMIKAFGSISLAEFLDFSQNSFKVDQQQIYTLPFLEKHWINDIELKNHHQFPNSHINLVLSKKKIKSPQKITEFIHRSDFIVIGSGIAGLSAALELSKHGKVLIITKGKLRDANTEYAQGGIAAVISPKDDFPAHIADTHLVGAGLTDTEAVKILVEEGSARVKELIKMGVPFDRDEDGQISLAQEGGHSFPRILHAGGDATGREIERFLSQKVIQNKKITIFTGVFVTDLLVKNKTAYGVKAVVQESGQEIDFLAGATLIATGGFSQIYLMSTNPLSATGDLIACCYRVGGQVEDMEFVQFHPTTLVIPPEKRIANPLIAYLPQNFLISEAVRGAGGILKNIKGESFMKKYDPRGELASRDIVSRAIFSEMAKTKAEFVYLDVAHIHDELTKTPIKFKERFPTIYARCLEIGLDLDQENLIPVAPAAHYTMGGIKINVNGQTNIKGLYAAGEVSRVGVHGANRLASNSLLEGLVFGERAGKSMAKYIKSTKKILNKKDFNLSPSKKIFATTKEVASEMDDLKTFDQKIKTLMTKYVGIIRHAEGLNIALKELTKIEKQLLHSQFQPSIGLRIIQNKLAVAKLVTQVALCRTESRGAHFRSDG